MRPRIVCGLTVLLLAPVLTFAPAPVTASAAGSYVTRAEFVADLCQAAGLKPVDAAVATFTDVPPSNPDYGYIEAAVGAGWIAGVSATLFDPSGPLTRAQVAKIEVLALGDGPLAARDAGARTAFADDAQIPSWARGYIVAAVSLGLVKGYPNGDYMPSSPLSAADEPFFLAQYAALASRAAGPASSLTIAARPSTPVVGESVTLTPTVRTSSGTLAVSQGVTLSVTGAGATLGGDTFTATVPGTYVVNAADGSLRATLDITVAAAAGGPLLAAWGLDSSHTPPAVGENAATAAMWAAASPDLVVTATDNVDGGSRPFLSLAPGQQVILNASWMQASAAALAGSSQPTWVVNGSPAVLPDASGSSWLPSPAAPSEADSNGVAFQAATPGEYVVQAVWDGVKSIPLVLTVGLSQLAAQTVALTPATLGVASLTPAQVSLDGVDEAAVASAGGSQAITNLVIGTPDEGWIPVSGSVPASWMNASWSPTVTVEVWDRLGSGNTQDYALPLTQTGAFSGVVASPFAGNITVVFVPSDYSLSLSSPQPNDYFSAQVDVPQAASLPANLQASPAIDLNIPSLATALDTAGALWAAAPDPTSGLEAISNWVSSLVIYDFAKEQGLRSAPWSTADQTYAAGTGVCQDYADLLVALYRGLGIPSVVEYGYANGVWGNVPQTSADSHAWVVANWNGSAVIADPTWDASDAAVNDSLTNAYFTPTAWFSATHVAGGVENYDPVQ